MTARELSGVEEPSAPAASVPESRRGSGSRSLRSTGLAARYRSLFVIGRGGMGTVEAALEIEPPGSERDPSDPTDAYERIVALKRLLPDAARDKRRVDMFLREARLAAMLEHPNVVGAYDYGEEAGELYLAMEYVEGQTLARLLRELSDAGERLPTEAVAHVLAEVCHGLHAAHELKDPATGQPLSLVHRDVSPQNVMLGYDGSVRLLDFGVAKIETENVTKTGEVKGKTAYMSPEQAMGDALDRRSDLFGVGALLFECFALRRMWGDGTDMEVIRKLALEEPPPLSDASASVPAELAELYARLVARKATDRPASAEEVARVLAPFGGEPDADARKTALRTILDEHFAEQAREQRTRLTRALQEIAPDQAEELRESVLPTTALTPIRIRRAVSEETTSPAPTSPVKRIALVGALAVVVLVVWRILAPAQAPPEPTPPPPPVATATAIPTATAAALPTAADTVPAPATASAPASARPAPSARPTASARIVAVPSVTPSVRPAPSASAPRPPQLDEHPF